MYVLLLPIVFAALVVLALLSGMLRCWRVACSLLFLALVVSWRGEVFPLHLVSAIQFSPSRSEGDTLQTLRVIAYNAFGRGEYFLPRCKEGQGIPEFEAWLRRYDADIILLEEFQSADLHVLIDTLDAHFPYSLWHHQYQRSLGNGEDMVLSRYPIHDIRRVTIDATPLPDSLREAGHYGGPIVQTFHVDAPQGEVLVVQCHLKSNDYTTTREQVVADTTKVRWIDGWDDYISSTRFSYQVRPYEARAIIHHVREVEQWTGPLIVAGDMNDLGGSETLRRLQEGLQLEDAWWRGGFGFGFTYTAHHMLLRLDHVLYSPHFKVRSAYVDQAAAFSDHLPIITDLEWR